MGGRDLYREHWGETLWVHCGVYLNSFFNVCTVRALFLLLGYRVVTQGLRAVT